jgi:hypothetical protein
MEEHTNTTYWLHAVYESWPARERIAWYLSDAGLDALEANKGTHTPEEVRAAAAAGTPLMVTLPPYSHYRLPLAPGEEPADFVDLAPDGLPAASEDGEAQSV